jgi:hypothetical protein
LSLDSNRFIVSMKVPSTHDKAEQKQRLIEKNSQQQTQIKPTLIALALLGFGFILPWLAMISLEEFFQINKDKIADAVINYKRFALYFISRTISVAASPICARLCDDNWAY